MAYLQHCLAVAWLVPGETAATNDVANTDCWAENGSNHSHVVIFRCQFLINGEQE